MITKKVGFLSLIIFVLFCSCKDGVYTECKKYKDGKYELTFTNPNVPVTTIWRKGDQQIEKTSEGDSIVNRVEWVDDCTYVLLFQAGPRDIAFVNKPIQNKITAITKDGYEFETVLLDTIGIKFKGKATLVD